MFLEGSELKLNHVTSFTLISLHDQKKKKKKKKNLY